MRKALSGTLLTAFFVFAGAAAATAQDATAQDAPEQEAPRTTRDGVYTAEQAERGRALYMSVCVECHAQDEYRGEMMEGWVDAPLYDLYDIILSTMPEDNPGSLSRREYVDLIAFILLLNEMPAGDEPLSTRASALRNILFKWSDRS